MLGLVEAAHAALTEPFRPCLVMTDYREGNVTVSEHGGTWQISGVFDLMESAFGDGELALARQACAYLDEDPALAHAFLQAYVAARPPRPGILARLPVYVLHDRLIIWEYFQRPTRAPSWDADFTLRQWVAPYMSGLAEFAKSVMTAS